MKLIAYNVKTGVGCFECSNCEHLEHYKGRVRRRCNECGHADEGRQHTVYAWRKRRVGYSRLIPAEQWDNAKYTLRRAEKDHGMQFEIFKTFAGFRVIVKIESVYRNDPRAII